jgi:hypothetical protein
MATIATYESGDARWQDALSGTPRAHAIDRWIYVSTTALFIAIILTGFIPDSLEKIAAVRAGHRPPFPIVLHMHAVLMASFMTLLFTQTVLMATGRRELHMKVGLAAFVIAPALVLVGIFLVPTMYHQTSDALRAATAPAVRDKLHKALLAKDNIMLLQFRIALLFPLLLALGLRARTFDAGLHKRLMILASAIPLGAGIDRIEWLPGTLPASPLSSDLYMLAALSPMFIWDVIRNRRIHRAYWMWAALTLPVALVVYRAWNTPWWHAMAHRIMGV